MMEGKILEVIVSCNETIMLKSKTPSMVNQNKQNTAIHNIPEVCSSGVQAAFAGSMFRYPRAMQTGMQWAQNQLGREVLMHTLSAAGKTCDALRV